MNETLLRGLGVTAIFGGESEPDLVAWANALREGNSSTLAQATIVRHDKIEFLTPDRTDLPPLVRYAHLVLPDGATRVSGFVDSTRGCKHLCRHCPVVPVYEGKFRVVPVEVVMADIAQQIEAGAQHISFGDHDFLNGPTHALNVVHALHERWPHLTYDATIKIQHLIDHAELLPELKRTGCLFIIAAVESVDDRVLEYLAKHHTRADFYRAVGLVREASIALAPTWVAFHPWSTLDSYLDLLTSLVELRLVEAVPPVQLMIRLLIPSGSKLLALPGFLDLIGEFDQKLLGYPWKNPDLRVDALQREIQAYVAEAEKANTPRRAIFEHIWRMAHAAAGKAALSLVNTDLVNRSRICPNRGIAAPSRPRRSWKVFSRFIVAPASCRHASKDACAQPPYTFTFVVPNIMKSILISPRRKLSQRRFLQRRRSSAYSDCYRR